MGSRVLSSEVFMAGSALKVAPQINLDEFERRLRAAGSSSGAPEDPLDQLARLVGLDVSAAGAADRAVGAASKVEAPQSPQIRLPHIDEVADDSQAFDSAQYEMQHEVEAYDEAPADSLESAALRGALEHEASDEDFAPQAGHAYARPLYPQGLAPPPEAMSASRRSSRIPLTMGLLVSVGAIALVGAWAVKGAPGLPRTPPIIMAADGPTKVQPPSQDTVASPSDSAAILMKDQAGKAGPVKLVSSEEQPVDLQQQQAKTQPVTRSLAPAAVTSAAPAIATPAPAIATPAAVATSPVVATPAVATSSASAPIAPSPSVPVAALTTIGPTNAAPAAPAAFPEPKRVKTVSVRPDGSVISSGATAVADASAAATAPPAAVDADAMPQPANPPVPRARPSFDSPANTAAAQPATPKLDLPPKPSAKSTARVPIAKIDTTVAGAANQSPEAAAPAPAAEPTPLQLVPSLLERAVKAVGGQPQTQVAAADPVATSTTTPAAGGGAYAVQLAAPGTEQEAKSVSAHLQSKYAAELGGMQPSIHQADVNGRPLYRVRLGGLSKADAVSLCMKLKASGGDSACFVAKN
jgi:SPOR domain